MRDIIRTFFMWIVLLLSIHIFNDNILVIYLIGCGVNILMLSIDEEYISVESDKNIEWLRRVLLIFVVAISWTTLVFDLITYFIKSKKHD